MGIENFQTGDEEQSGNPSGTHIYFYERGHDRLPGDEGDDRYEQIAEAFENAKTSPDGIVRQYADHQYTGGLQQFLAEYVNAVADTLEEGDLSVLFERIFADESDEAIANMLASYLNENEAVMAQVAEKVNNDQTAEEQSDE